MKVTLIISIGLCSRWRYTLCLWLYESHTNNRHASKALEALVG